MEGKSLTTFEFDVDEYHCVARALSVGEWETFQERAFPLEDAQLKEDIILTCLLEPTALRERIVTGDIVAGIPLYIYSQILHNSGFDISIEDRTIFLDGARNHVSTNVVEGFRTMILAADAATYEDIQSMNMWELMERTALAEKILDIRQQNMIAALTGGSPLSIRWDTEEDEESRKDAELRQKMAEKTQEVSQLIAEQTQMRPGIGTKPLPPDRLVTTE